MNLILLRSIEFFYQLMNFVLEIFRNIIITYTHNENIYGHLYNDNSIEEISKFKKCFTYFFQNHTYGRLIANGISVAIFRYDNTFWIFYSHSRELNGRPAKEMVHTACLIRFSFLEIQCIEY